MYQEKQRDMKKSEIIEQYNSLGERVKEIHKLYVTTTNMEITGSIDGGYIMNSHWASRYSKDELEELLKNRMKFISRVEKELEIWKRTKDLKSTEEGRNFIKELEDKKKELEERIETSGKMLAMGFEYCLKKVGMEDWKVSRKEGIVPERSYVYFDIEKEGIDARLSIIVDLHNIKGMEVSSSLHCYGRKDISNFDENYWQFKGYTLIHENHEIFEDWVKKDFNYYDSELYRIREEIDKTDKILSDPTTEYLTKCHE